MGGNRTQRPLDQTGSMLYQRATMPSWDIWSKIWSYILRDQFYSLWGDNTFVFKIMFFVMEYDLSNTIQAPKCYFDNKKNHPFILHVRQNLSFWARFEPTSSWCQGLVLHHWATLPSWENKQNWLADLVHCWGFIFLFKVKISCLQKFVFYDGIWREKNYWRIWSPKILMTKNHTSL